MTPELEEAAKRIAHAILNRSTEGTATRVALKQKTADGERDLGGLNAIALAEVIGEELAALIAKVRRQAMEECAEICKANAMVSGNAELAESAHDCYRDIRARLAPIEGKEEGK